MDRSVIIDTEETDKRDVIIIIMGISIIALVCTLFFSLYNNINISAANTDVVETLPTVWQVILISILFLIPFLCGYATWRLILGSKSGI